MNPTTVYVDNSELRPPNYERKHTYGQAVYVAPGNLEVQFPGSPNYPPVAPTDRPGNYIILETDETNSQYSYVYSCDSKCKDENDVSTCSYKPHFWILVRENSNEQFGMTTKQRWARCMEIFKNAGASDNALEIMKWAHNEYDLEGCEA